MIKDQRNGVADNMFGKGFSNADALATIKGHETERIPSFAIRSLEIFRLAIKSIWDELIRAVPFFLVVV